MNIKRQKMLLSLSYLVIFVMCAIIFYPLLWIIGSSFNPGDSLSIKYYSTKCNVRSLS